MTRFTDNRCPNCGDQLANELEENSSDGEISEYLAGLRICICGWEGQVNDESLAEEAIEEEQLKFYSNRSKNAKKFEEEFVRKCEQKGWRIKGGNSFAAYLLKEIPKKIRNKVTHSADIEQAIKPTPIKKYLLQLFEEHKTYYYPVDEERIAIKGLPDFIVLRDKNKLPFWAEVKSGNAKLKKHQKQMKNKLEKIGFKVFVYTKNQKLSEMEKELKASHS